MADRAIDTLPEASVIGDVDLFVLEQNGSAKSLKGQTLRNYARKTGEDAANERIDEVVKHTQKGDRGVSIVDVTLESGTHLGGTTDRYRVNLDDGTYSTFDVYNGADGEGAVNTVAGKAGDVILTTSDVGLWVEADGDTLVITTDGTAHSQSHYDSLVAQVNEHDTKIDSLAIQITNIDARVTVLENEPKVPQSLVEHVESNDRRITNLEYASKNILYRTEADETEAYTKDMPTDAMPFGTFDYIGGKSMRFNQLVDFKFTNSTLAGLTADILDDGLGAKITGTPTGGWNYPLTQGMHFIKSHKYYFRGIKSEENANIMLRCYEIGNGVIFNAHNPINGNFIDSPILDTINGNGYFYLNVGSAQSTVADITVKPQLFDLTAMFGSGNEPTIEQFEAMFPSDYYPYTDGTIINADVDAVEIRGKNFLDFNNIADWGEHFTSEFIGGRLKLTTKKASSNAYTRFYGIPNNFKVGDILTISYGGSDSVNLWIWANDESWRETYDISRKASSKSITFTCTKEIEKYKYLMIQIYFGAQNAGDVKWIDYIQIEKGSSATSYSPYIEPHSIALADIIHKYFPNGMRSAGTAHDVLDIENGVAVTNVGKYHITEANFRNKYGNFYYLTLPSELPKPIVGGTAEGKVISSNNQTYLFSYSGNGFFFVDANTIIYGAELASNWATDNDLKAWLRYNPYDIYYAMAEPIVTPIDSADIEALKTLAVEGGGTITFKQSDEYHLPVPNKETWLIKTGGIS